MNPIKNVLAVIPARGGSKGIPHKNIKLLDGKPLIAYSIDVARALLPDEQICVSTDDPEIIGVVEDYGLPVPFVRPAELASDTATTNDVLLHAVRFYENAGKKYDTLLLLQPTSPLRTARQVEEALALYHAGLDMVVSVKRSHAATVLCRENEAEYLELVFNKSARRRQELPEFYEYNGAIYVIGVGSLKEKGLSGFERIKKYVMDERTSVDIDTRTDWLLAEACLNEK